MGEGPRVFPEDDRLLALARILCLPLFQGVLGKAQPVFSQPKESLVRV